MKNLMFSIGLLLACGSSFASTQAHYNDARQCNGTAQNTKTGATASFTASAGEFSPDQFALVDTTLKYSFLSPKMSRDPVTGGYVGAKGDSVYRANYISGKDIFEIISEENIFTAVCLR